MDLSLPLSYGKKLEKWLLSPAQHQLHHSVEKQHYEKNFGVVLAICDRLGNTLIPYEQGQKLRLEVTDKAGEHNNLWQAYWKPIQQMSRSLTAPLRGMFNLPKTTTTFEDRNQ